MRIGPISQKPWQPMRLSCTSLPPAADLLDRALQRREEPAGAFDLASAAAAERNHRAGRLAARGGLLAQARQVGGRIQQPFRRDDHGFSFAPYSARISGTCAGVTLP